MSRSRAVNYFARVCGLTIRSSRPRIVASTACYTLRLHAVAAPLWVGLTQALGLIVNWLNDIKKLGIEPPQSNNLSIVIDLPPVSLQATGESKRAFIRKVREQCSCYSFLLTSDVQIGVTWHIHEQERYETDRSPDVDNILKPLLDGLCGPEGILIDDNQVQSISCS